MKLSVVNINNNNIKSDNINTESKSGFGIIEDYNEVCDKEQVDLLLKNIEQIILEKYSTDKTPTFNLTNQVNTGVLKLFSDSCEKKKNIDLILKISGLWEDNSSYGITYKFLSVF